jgi:peptidoglycan/xylan/chitin deacetylase (PgdA/CDA1 family)
MELLVVNYHYFRDETYPSGIYPINRAQLLRQVEELGKSYAFISHDDLKAFVQSDALPQRKYCLLTFDDGLKEQMEAFALLSAKGVPSVYYVPTNPLATATVLDVHKMHYIRTRFTDDELFAMMDSAYDISQHDFDHASLATQYRYDTTVAKKVKYFLNFEMEVSEKEQFIDRIFSPLVEDESAFAKELYMNADDLRTLARAGALGSHGATHRPLARMTAEEARRDIAQSLCFLKSHTGSKVSSFSYPYGGTTAVAEHLGDILQENGVTFAFTMERGVNRDLDFRRAFFLKRVDTNDAPGGKSFTKILT